MNRSVQFALMGILFAAAGFAIGTQVRWSADPTHSDDSAFASSTSLDTSSRPDRNEEHANDKFAHWVDEHRAAANSAHIIPASFSETNTSSVAANGKDQSSIHGIQKRQIIREHLPNADDEVIEIWASEYANASADELRFILQQKQALALPSLKVTPQLNSGVTISPGTTVQESRQLFLEQLMQSNLTNLKTVGFRRREILELPADTRPMVERSFLCFDSGPIVATAHPLHVAIVDEPHLFFRVGPDRFTRCGMFRILTDGKIGFETSEGAFTVTDSELSSADANIQIDGSIVSQGASGTPEVIGMLQLARVTNPQALKTQDGVLFSLPKTAIAPETLAAAGYIRCGCLELSNARQLR